MKKGGVPESKMLKCKKETVKNRDDFVKMVVYLLIFKEDRFLFGFVSRVK